MINVPCIQCDYNPLLKITGSWLIELPTAAVSVNQIKGNGKGRSGWAYRRVRDTYLEMLRARIRGIPVATEKRRVFFTRYYAGKAKRYDRDNLIAGMKPLRDCLTELLVIKDDSERWLEAHYQQKPYHVNQISIQLEDLIWLP